MKGDFPLLTIIHHPFWGGRISGNSHSHRFVPKRSKLGHTPTAAEEGSFQHVFLTVFSEKADRSRMHSRSVPLSCWWQRCSTEILEIWSPNGADRIMLVDGFSVCGMARICGSWTPGLTSWDEQWELNHQELGKGWEREKETHVF